MASPAAAAPSIEELKKSLQDCVDSIMTNENKALVKHVQYMMENHAVLIKALNANEDISEYTRNWEGDVSEAKADVHGLTKDEKDKIDELDEKHKAVVAAIQKEKTVKAGAAVGGAGGPRRRKSRKNSRRGNKRRANSRRGNKHRANKRSTRRNTRKH